MSEPDPYAWALPGAASLTNISYDPRLVSNEMLAEDSANTYPNQSSTGGNDYQPLPYVDTALAAWPAQHNVSNPYPTATPLACPSFHPQVGWYYPAGPPQGYSNMTPLSAVPSAPYSMSTTQNNNHPGETAMGSSETRSKKRKQGQSHGDSLTAADSPISSKKTKNSIERVCVCNDSGNTGSQKIKRPANAFIIFRKHIYREIQGELRGTSVNGNGSGAVSKIASERWKKLSPGEKQKFFDLAAVEKQNHMDMFPDYKYRPNRGRHVQFGTSDCTCGAYQTNVSALARRVTLPPEISTTAQMCSDAAPCPDTPSRNTRSRTRSRSKSGEAAPVPVADADAMMNELFPPEASPYVSVDFSVLDELVNYDAGMGF